MSENLANAAATFAELTENNPQLNPLSEIIEQVMSMPDDQITDQTIEIITGMMNGALTQSVRQDSVKQLIQNFEDLGYNRAKAQQELDALRIEMNGLIDTLAPSKGKRKLLENIFTTFYELFDGALEQYHTYSIELPMTLEEGARVPTYAHDDDAAADLYAAETVTIPGLSFGNMIRTGVHIALPEGWVAFIFPRSSIGAKTPLRLSNSAGIIDSGYRGPLGVLYDNISDSDYEIKAGDRIAQLIVMPSYRFKAKVVDNLETSDRGEGGFGSSGK